MLDYGTCFKRLSLLHQNWITDGKYCDGEAWRCTLDQSPSILLLSPSIGCLDSNYIGPSCTVFIALSCVPQTPCSQSLCNLTLIIPTVALSTISILSGIDDLLRLSSLSYSRSLPGDNHGSFAGLSVEHRLALKDEVLGSFVESGVVRLTLSKGDVIDVTLILQLLQLLLAQLHDIVNVEIAAPDLGLLNPCTVGVIW